MAELPLIANLVPYPRYRVSEADWLGEIPAHWETRRAKYLLKEINSRSETGKEQLLRISQYTGVTQRNRADGLDEPDTRADSLVGYKRVKPDDLVVNIMLAWNGSMGVSKYNGIASPAYCVYRFEDGVQPWYMHNLLRSPAYKARIRALSTGIVESRLRLYSDDLGRIEILLPSPEEQVAIVRFLDWATGRLDRVIRAKRKVIALLNEQKQAIIQRAVTRGIDPSVPLSASGINWLGDIPQHWEVRRLSSIANFASGKAHEQFFEPTGRHVCVTARFVSTSGSAVKFSSMNFCSAARGDVLMVMSDLPNGRALARAYLVEDDRSYAVNQRVCKLTPCAVEPRFLAYYANRSPHFLKQDDGMNQTHLSNYDFKTLPVALPPPLEQSLIADYIDGHANRIEGKVSRFEREIELLREYRTRVVADVVTGKLDVREAATHLHDETALVEDDIDVIVDSETTDEDLVA